jgi:hypothetical protein
MKFDIKTAHFIETYIQQGLYAIARLKEALF